MIYAIARDSYGYKVIRVDVEGQLAQIHPMQIKWKLVEDYRFIYLGSDWEGKGYTVTLPADPEENRSETVLDGYMESEELAQILASEWGIELKEKKTNV